MNINFNKIKRNVTKTVSKAKDVSGNMIELAKAKFRLSEINTDIEEKYIKIGKLVYNSDENGNVEDDISKLCDNITELKSEYENLKEKINDMSGKKVCPVCGEKNDKDYDYCPKCGNSMSRE